MIRWERSVVWYVIYTILAGLSAVIATSIYGKSFAYAVIAGAWVAYVVVIGLLACSVVLVPVTWLVVGRRGTPRIVMLVLGALFALISLPMTKRFGVPIEEGLVGELLVPAALIGGIDGYMAEVISRSWCRAPETQTTRGKGSFGFRRVYGEPTMASRSVVLFLVASLAAYLWLIERTVG